MVDDLQQDENINPQNDLDSSNLLVASLLEIKRGRLQLAADINLNLARGDLLYIKGANGAGKSTLLRILVKLYNNYHGQVLWNASFSYLGHRNGMLPSERISELFHLYPAQKVTQLLSVLGVEKLLYKKASQLSQGQRRILAIAKVVLDEKKVWVLDEPFEALDTYRIEKVEALIKQQRSKGAVILTSHIRPGLENMTEITIGVGGKR